jgi:hypothetical protein
MEAETGVQIQMQFQRDQRHQALTNTWCDIMPLVRATAQMPDNPGTRAPNKVMIRLALSA